MNKKKAFTLAEVLITLGIIGVVAAMTIPTLVANYNTKSWNTAATVFESKLGEALKVMNSQQTLAGHTSTESFVEELSKHFKISKTCSNNELSKCFEEQIGGLENIVDILNPTETSSSNNSLDVTVLKTAISLGQPKWTTNTVGVQFANGVTAVLAYNDFDCMQDPYSNTINGLNCISAIYDVSGFKSPNEDKKDVRTINSITNKCSFRAGSVCYGSYFYAPTPLTYQECLDKKDSLGIKRCANRNDDYWAGAVAKCGHVNNLPTMAQLAQIGNYIYGVDTITEDNDFYVGKQLNYDKIASLKIVPRSTYLDLWSGEEIDSTTAKARGFFRDGKAQIQRYVRHDSASYVGGICIVR